MFDYAVHTEQVGTVLQSVDSSFEPNIAVGLHLTVLHTVTVVSSCTAALSERLSATLLLGTTAGNLTSPHLITKAVC